MNKHIVLSDGHEVEILDEERNLVAQVGSLHAAGKKCKVHSSTIWKYLFIKSNGKSRKEGVLSTVTGKRYHFKLK